jgi:hypothetical protein
MGNSDSKGFSDPNAMKKMALRSIMEDSSARLTELTREIIEVDRRVIRTTRPYEREGWLRKKTLLRKNYKIVFRTCTMVTNALNELCGKEINAVAKSINSKTDACMKTVMSAFPQVNEEEINAVLVSVLKK